MKNNMGLFNGFMSPPAEVSTKQISLEYAVLLVEGEYIEKAYKVDREKFILTNKRMLLIAPCKGDKLEHITIPYCNIRKFSKESRGLMQSDSELKIWLKEEPVPIKRSFKNCEGVNEIYQILSKYTCL